MTATSGVGPSSWAQLIVVFGTPIAGFFAGLGLAAWLAPGSGVAAAISGMLLPTAYAAGLIVWAGVDAVLRVFVVLKHRSRTVRTSTLAHRSGRWFVPLSMACSGAGGMVVGIIPGGAGVLTTTAVYTAAGVAFGWILSRLAAAGYIPAPDV